MRSETEMIRRSYGVYEGWSNIGSALFEQIVEHGVEGGPAPRANGLALEAVMHLSMSTERSSCN